MAIRSYNFPSSEVKEVDLTNSAITDSGSVVLVTGYTNKGQIFSPTKIYGTPQYVEQFGEPMTDAEFYTYLTVENVLSEGGTPVVIRLPYDNASSKNYNGIYLKFDSNTTMDGIDTAISSAVKSKGFSTFFRGLFEKISLTNEQYATVAASGNFAVLNNDLGNSNFVIMDKRKSICTDHEGNGGIFIVPFDMTRAMMVQRLLDDGTSTASTNLLTKNLGLVGEVYYNGKEISDWSIGLNGSIMTMTDNGDKFYSEDSLSKQIANLFPNIEPTIISDGDSENIEIDKRFSNYIGIAVCKIVKSDSTVVRNVPMIVESFVGSVMPVRNPITGVSEYIVDVINNESSYIQIFANRNNQTEIGQTASSNMLPLPESGDDMAYFVGDQGEINNIISFKYGSDDKIIKGASIGADIVKAFNKITNIDDMQIDVVSDSGVSSIAQFTNSADGEHYQPDIDIDTNNSEIRNATQISTWMSVVTRLEKLCSGDRKDCMAIIDAPRHASLKASIPIVNDYDYDKSFANNLENGYSIVSSALNSSYAAIYANWVKVFNPYNNKDTWVPPSCFVAAKCCACDLRYNPWNSPAFLERGVIGGVTEISIKPGKAEESFLYPKSLNYIKYFNAEGFVIWGQKTSQKKEGAFSRVNVRRSILRMERFIYNVGRQFIGKGNSVYNRRVYTDIVDPYLSRIKSAGGLYDYLIVCDDTNNTPEVIDANEFRVTVLLKPVREAEYVVATVVATATGANFQEVINSGNF